MKNKQEIVDRLHMLYKKREEVIRNGHHEMLDTQIQILEWVLDL